ncbi:MAG: InlB B-repeat-containing protein, partial [Candidatus Saliniplasma sp.]
YTRSQDYVFTTLDHFILTLNIQGEGTVEVDGEELSSGSQWMDEGLATLKAIPNSGWEFEEWTGDTQDIADIFSEETTIDMKDDYSITAIFQLSEYDLTIDSTDGGSVTDPGEGTFTYTYGGWVNLQAQADTNYVFVEWTGDTENIEDVNAANTHIIVEGDYNITAVFELQYDFYELTVNTEGDGNVTVSPEPDATMGKYQEGTWVYLDSSPDPSWELSHWSGDLPEGHEEYDQIGIYMDSDKTVTAHFVYVEMFELTVNIEGSGSVDIFPDQAEYEDGTLVDIHALPSDGWEFSHWTGDIPDEYEYSSYISVSMDRDRTLTAHFVEEIPDDVDRYHLDTVVEGSGYVDVDPWKSEYIDGDRVELTAVPEFGWEFVEWTGDASGTSSEITITMDGNKTIVAVFQQTAAEIEVTGFVVDPTEGDEPLTVSISANIENVGTETGTIQLTMGTDPVGQWTLEPGDTISVDETHTFEELGLYYFHLGNQSIAVRVGDVVVYSLNVVVEGEGSVRPTQELYEEGETVTLTAVPVDGWEFVEWTGDYLAADIQITFNMDQDKTITAVFREVDDPDDPDDPDDTDDTDDQEEDPNFMDALSNYWWMLVVVALAGVILLVFVMKRGKTPTPMEEPPVEENEEMIDDEPPEEFDELDDMEEPPSEEEF